METSGPPYSPPEMKESQKAIFVSYNQIPRKARRNFPFQKGFTEEQMVSIGYYLQKIIKSFGFRNFSSGKFFSPYGPLLYEVDSDFCSYILLSFPLVVRKKKFRFALSCMVRTWLKIKIPLCYRK